MLVVFEGIDGSGKTTISNRVAAELSAEGLSVKHLRAEGKFVSAVSEGIREFGRNAQNLDLAWQAEFCCT
jgi:dTMP kinase